MFRIFQYELHTTDFFGLSALIIRDESGKKSPKDLFNSGMDKSFLIWDAEMFTHAK
jgi:hypothetical protein